MPCAPARAAPRSCGFATLFPMHRKGAEGLGDGHQFHAVDVDVRRLTRAPERRLCDVLRAQWFHALVDFLRLRRIAVEAHQRKLRLREARLKVGHAHARAVQVRAQVERELLDESLGRAVGVAARVGIVRRRGADVDPRRGR